MPAYSSRKYVTKVDYLADFVGADVPRNLVKIAIAAQDDAAKPIETKDQQIPYPLEQDADGATLIVIKADNVGLAKGSDIESLKGSQYKDFTTLEADVEDGVSRLASLDDKVDAKLSTRASEATLSSIDGKIDANLSTRASESTLSGIKAQTDKLQFDARNLLKIFLTDDQLEAVDRTTTQHEFVASGLEVAFNNYTVSSGLETRVDGKMLVKKLVTEGKLIVNGVVETW